MTGNLYQDVGVERGMIMILRLRLLIATLFALYSSSVFAVGLGELELKSHLNQRFDAEIVLTNVGDLGLDEIIPNLASQEDFNRVGVPRDYHLTDLRFKVRQREDGEYVVQVTSSRAIIEPFLNFIVEAIWPTGRILREYTVLLDPPVFGSGGVEKIDPGTSSQAAPSSSDRRPSSNRRREIPPAPTVSGGRTEGVVTQDDEYGMTGPGDTLWKIAMKVRPNEEVSVQQTMLALQRANPEAFINNNINLLKAGHVLRIPDMGEIRAESTREAIAEVQIQNEEFEEYRSGEVTQLDARRTARRDDTNDERTDDGELKLLAADRSSGNRSGADGEVVAELENELAVAREDLDRARRATSEMNVRLDDLEGQLETLNEIVKLKDDQLAALRAELNRQQTAAAGQPATPAVSTPQTSSGGSLLSKPMVLGGVGVLLIALVAGALIMMRRRGQSDDDDTEDFPGVLMDDEPALALADEDVSEESEEPAETEADEDVTQQTSDVIGEAEIYIAYGRFPQAISFLQNAIENEPDRTDIQLKLLEVYVQTEDATAFNLQLEQLKLLGDEEATNKGLELQSQIPGAAEVSAASMDATIVSSEPVAAIEEPADDDDDDELSFDLDDLDTETDDDELDLGVDDGEELSLDEAMELGDADLDLDLDAALEEVAPAEEEEDEIDLDLDDEIDLDFDDDTSDELDSTQKLDSDELDLDGDDDGIELDLGDDDLDLGDDDLGLGDDDLEIDLGDDDDLGELNLDEDASSKLDLARAYIEMGDNDGAKALLEDVINEGDDQQISEANELLGKIG